MPNVDDLKTSKFITKSDIGKGLLLTIKKWVKTDVSMENQAEDMKYCLIFEEIPKPFVLNQTNGKLIQVIVGSADFDDWVGEKIVMFIDPTVMFAGEMKGGIRVRAPKNQAQAEPEPPKDDSIPF